MVSLAATEEETELAPYTKAIYSLKADDFDVDAYTENQILSYTGRTGEAKIAVQDNGNKYAVMQLNGSSLSRLGIMQRKYCIHSYNLLPFFNLCGKILSLY